MIGNKLIILMIIILFFACSSKKDDLELEKDLNILTSVMLSEYIKFRQTYFNPDERFADDDNNKQYLIEIIKLHDKLGKNNYVKCLSYYLLGEYSNSIKCSDELLKTKDDSNILIIKGAALSKSNKLEEADDCFNKAARIDEKNYLIYYYKCRLCIYSGKFEEALSNIIKVKQLKPNLGYIDNTAIPILRLVRLLNGNNLPPIGWPSYFDEVFKKENLNSILATIRVGKDIAIIQDKENNISYINRYDKRRIKIIVNGNENSPFIILDNFYIWDGAIIFDPEYDFLIANGTNFKHIIKQGSTKYEKSGIIENYKLKTIYERKYNN